MTYCRLDRTCVGTPILMTLEKVFSDMGGDNRRNIRSFIHTQDQVSGEAGLD